MRTIDWLTFVFMVSLLIFTILQGWARRRVASSNADLLTPLIGARLTLVFVSGGEGSPVLFKARGTFDGREVFIKTTTPWSIDKLHIYSAAVSLRDYHSGRRFWNLFFIHTFISDGNTYCVLGHELSCPEKVDFINKNKAKLPALKCHLEDLCKIAEKIEGGEISEPFLLKDRS